MYCKHCGAKVDDDAAFCSECGKKTGKAASPSEPAQTEHSQPSDLKKKSGGGKTALIIILAVIALSAVLLLLYIFLWPSPAPPVMETVPETPAPTAAVQQPESTPVMLSKDMLVAGLDRNIAANIGNIRWEATGESVIADPNAELPAGYPRVFDVSPGTSVFEFYPDTMTVQLTKYDNGIQTEQTIVPFSFLNNTYAGAFKRTQHIDGKDRVVESVFFISDGYLYECEVVDGIDGSNYMAYQNTGAASAPSEKAQFDTMVAGLDRNILAALEDMVWLSSGTSIAAQPNGSLPAGYPRTFDVPYGRAQYTFDVKKMEVTLVNYDTDWTKTSEATVPFTLINNTYVSAFEGSQVVDGQSREIKSVYFISNGTLYECQVVDGVDASNYIAYEPVG